MESKKNTSDDNDPEYWNQMAEIIGNPVPEFEDDSDEVDEDGVYRGGSSGTPTSFEKKVEILRELFIDWKYHQDPQGFRHRAGTGFEIIERVHPRVFTHVGLYLAVALKAGFISENEKVRSLISDCFGLLLSELKIADNDFKDMFELLK